MVMGRFLFVWVPVPFCCFDAFICTPINKHCPNDGAPVGCKNKSMLALALALLNGEDAPTPAPPLMPPRVRMDDARNRFVALRPIPTPVACGRNPTPSEEPPPPSNGVS